MKQPTLETPRLILRPFHLSDADAVQRLAGVAAVSDPTMNIPHPYPDGLAESWITIQGPAWDAGTDVTFAVVAKDDELRGAVHLRLTPNHRRGELGYWIGQPYWGQGFATEAASAVLGFGFDRLQLNRIEAHHLLRNPASGRVMEKAGMSREGIQRERFLKNGQFEDVVGYAILRRDWALKGLPR
jgi:RimJ/RimL family protein N-acetyltransferase